MMTSYTTPRRAPRLLLLLSCLLPVHTNIFAQAGEAGVSFLKPPLETRATALGDAVTASATGTGSVLTNPAGLLHAFQDSRSTELLAVYKQWVQDASLQFLGAGFSLAEGHALALGIAASTSGDIEIRSRPGQAEGTFAARNVMIGASYARRVSGSLTAGVTLKFLYEKLLVDEAGGFGVDAGVRWSVPLEGLVLGASILHLGGMQRLRSEATRLPTSLRAGAAWTGMLADGAPLLTAGVDIVQNIPERRTTFHAGADVSFAEIFSVRAGYQAGESARGFSAGAGITYGIAGLDYAFAPLSADLGNTHTIGVRLLF